jgi:hypothetical protein
MDIIFLSMFLSLSFCTEIFYRTLSTAVDDQSKKLLEYKKAEIINDLYERF